MQPGSLGALFTLAGLIGGATALNAPRIVRRWGKLKTATTMQYLSAPAMLLTGFAPVLPLAAAGEFSRIVLRGLFDPTYASFTMDQVSSRYRATLSGFYSVTWSVGFAIGPTLAGWLFQNLGTTPVFIVGAVFLVSAATLLRLFFGGSSRPPRHQARRRQRLRLSRERRPEGLPRLRTNAELSLQSLFGKINTPAP